MLTRIIVSSKQYMCLPYMRRVDYCDLLEISQIMQYCIVDTDLSYFKRNRRYLFKIEFNFYILYKYKF